MALSSRSGAQSGAGWPNRRPPASLCIPANARAWLLGATSPIAQDVFYSALGASWVLEPDLLWIHYAKSLRFRRHSPDKFQHDTILDLVLRDRPLSFRRDMRKATHKNSIQGIQNAQIGYASSTKLQTSLVSRSTAYRLGAERRKVLVQSVNSA